MLKTVARDSLARNSVLIMASTAGSAGLGYLYWLLAARELAPAAIGPATALISISAVVSMVSNLGVGHMFIQRLPGTAVGEWSRIVSAGLFLGCGATALVSLVAGLALPELGSHFAFLGDSSGVAALVVTAVALTASTLLDNVFVAHRAGHGMLLRNLALAAGKLVTLAVLTWAGYGGAAVVLIAWTAPSVAVTAYTLVSSLPRLRPGARLGVSGIGTELRPVGGSLRGHHLINLAQAGPTALLPVLVTARLGPEANAHFYVAWMTASMLFMVSPAVASAFYAERTNAAPTGLTRAAGVVLAVTGPPALLLFFAGERILGLFSADFAAEGGLLLKILVLAALPDAVTNLVVAHWRALGQFRRCLRLNLLMATTCLTLTWLWLPGTGIEAAGLAWLVGQSVGAVAVAVSSVRKRGA
ncbi:sugar transporter [Actinoplanes sp. TRM 88003]|uniref:Sugar transporter n=1 Tax=Paractinoplanes aksuensis TaxID=2939490 RepID=A0ABT1DIP5_9ACTN|nr:sugar transporter [Actinoplanes aksuensis]MCO8270694.1 sugar transporter [Actinoplanes aksuensis]